MNILLYAIMLVGGVAGLFSTLYLVLAMPVLFVWKVFRKVKYHISLFD